MLVDIFSVLMWITLWNQLKTPSLNGFFDQLIGAEKAYLMNLLRLHLCFAGI